MKNVISKIDKIWNDISLYLGEVLTSESIYTMVTSNYHGVNYRTKELLNIEHSKYSDNNEDLQQSLLSDSYVTNVDCSVYEKKIVHTVPTEIFNNLIEAKSYPRSREGRDKKRQFQRFVQGKWQPYFYQVLWESRNIKCGFNYKNNYIDLKSCSGKYTGKFLIKVMTFTVCILGWLLFPKLMKTSPKS